MGTKIFYLLYLIFKGEMENALLKRVIFFYRLDPNLLVLIPAHLIQFKNQNLEMLSTDNKVMY
ncbi:hypothetical protein LK13_09315 [Paenibacillus polymyxa]|nr:hypothetical protein LK13_09315 [Paenibacillus polymyxa]